MIFQDFVYIRCNLPQLTGFNIVHFGTSSQPAYSELVDRWKSDDVTAIQKEVIEIPRSREMLFNVVVDSLQLNNLARKSAYADKLEILRKALDIWAKKTGDTLPKIEDMTPDRNDRETWRPVPGHTGHPDSGTDWPGLTTKAWTTNHPGPVRD